MPNNSQKNLSNYYNKRYKMQDDAEQAISNLSQRMFSQSNSAAPSNPTSTPKYNPVTDADALSGNSNSAAQLKQDQNQMINSRVSDLLSTYDFQNDEDKAATKKALQNYGIDPDDPSTFPKTSGALGQ